MRIDALNQISQVYGTKGSRKANYASRASESDKLEISSFGKDLQAAKQAVGNTPDIREDKVAEYKRRIAEGRYQISAEAFADKVLKRLENA